VFWQDFEGLLLDPNDAIVIFGQLHAYFSAHIFVLFLFKNNLLFT